MLKLEKVCQMLRKYAKAKLESIPKLDEVQKSVPKHE